MRKKGQCPKCYFEANLVHFMPIEHGTNNGWYTERRRGLKNCQPCKEAKRVYQIAYRERNPR